MVELLNKDYDGESLYDATRDFAEAFDSKFTPAFADIPTDKYGIQTGKFTVIIQWTPA
jgi:hypothetical protein